jgi:hypothetical protein
VCADGLIPIEFKDPKACALAAEEYTLRLTSDPKVVVGEARCESFTKASD